MNDLLETFRTLHLHNTNSANSRVLLAAAAAGTITALECAMPKCVCPEGRGHFERAGVRSPWAPSADRYPLPGRDGGKYDVANVRLAHRRCNTLDGTGITQEHLRENGYYGSPKHRETGRQLGLGRREGAREWWKTPEGRAARALGIQRLKEWNAAHEWTPEERAASGRILNEWRASHPEAARKASLAAREKAGRALAERRKDPAVRAALVEHGRRLGTEHGVRALREWGKSPEAHEIAVANGHRLAALSRARSAAGDFKTPERIDAARRAGGEGACQRWNLNRGKPCVCGHHAGTA